MVIFVLMSILSGLIASGVSLAYGFSLLSALLLYSLTGMAVFGLVVLRAVICLTLQGETETRELG